MQQDRAQAAEAALAESQAALKVAGAREAELRAELAKSLATIAKCESNAAASDAASIERTTSIEATKVKAAEQETELQMVGPHLLHTLHCLCALFVRIVCAHSLCACFCVFAHLNILTLV
jgi:hypothetical protein